MQNYEGQYNSSVSDIWTISPNKVNTVRAFYSLNHYIIGNIYGDQHMLSDLGSNAAMGGNYNAQPLFKVTGYWQMGTSNAGPNNLPSSTLGASDNFIWTLGKHELKLGGAYMWDRFTSTGGASSNGLFTFTARTSSENALVNFLIGQASTLTQNNGVFFRSHSQDPSVYAQDNWNISRRLTLNLGVRWEYFPMYTGQNDTATFVPGNSSRHAFRPRLSALFSRATREFLTESSTRRGIRLRRDSASLTTSSATAERRCVELTACSTRPSIRWPSRITWCSSRTRDLSRSRTPRTW